MKLRVTVSICAFLVSGSVFAHSLNLFVRDEGDSVKGSVYFTGGTPAMGLAIQVLDENGTEIGGATSDENGDFVYTGAHTEGPVRFVVTTADGHRAEAALAANAASPSSDVAPAGVPGSTQSYEADLTEIHEAIDRLEHRIWLRDVIGGIGYIFGLAGLWALWNARGRSSGH